MTEKITLGLTTVAENRLRLIPKGRVVTWDSVNETLDSNYDFANFESDFLIKDAAVALSSVLVNIAANQLAQAKVRNTSNVLKYDDTIARLAKIQDVFSNGKVALVTDINYYESLSSELVAKEESAHAVFYNLNKYIGTLESLKLKSYLMLNSMSNLEIEAEDLEVQVAEYLDRIRDLHNEIEDVNNKTFNIQKQLSLLRVRTNPTLQQLADLRVQAYDTRTRMLTLTMRLRKLESYIITLLDKLCELETEAASMDSFRESVKASLLKLEFLAKEYNRRITVLFQNIGRVFERTKYIENLADRIAYYIVKMTNFINEGLLEADTNVQIEYTEGGFAKIHANIPDYPPRKIPKRTCYPNSSINITYPAPPCPPIIPTCPEPEECEEPPDTAADPSCTVHFSGILIGDIYVDKWLTKAFTVDIYSEIVKNGEYPQNKSAFPKAVATTFDGIAVSKGTRLRIWSGENFTGTIVLDVTGPMIVNNAMFSSNSNVTAFMSREWDLFPKDKRLFKSGMPEWSFGSCKIECMPLDTADCIPKSTDPKPTEAPKTKDCPDCGFDEEYTVGGSSERWCDADLRLHVYAAHNKDCSSSPIGVLVFARTRIHADKFVNGTDVVSLSYLHYYSATERTALVAKVNSFTGNFSCVSKIYDKDWTYVVYDAPAAKLASVYSILRNSSSSRSCSSPDCIPCGGQAVAGFGNARSFGNYDAVLSDLRKLNKIRTFK